MHFLVGRWNSRQEGIWDTSAGNLRKPHCADRHDCCTGCQYHADCDDNFADPQDHLPDHCDLKV